MDEIRPVHGGLLFLCNASLVMPVAAGLLRDSVLRRYAQYCNVVRGRLLIDQ